MMASLLYFVVIGSAWIFSPHALGDDYNLSIGTSQTIDTPSEIVKVEAEQEGLLDIRPLDNKKSLRITARQNGSTNLTITTRKGEEIRHSVTISGRAAVGSSRQYSSDSIADAINGVLEKNGIYTIKAKAYGKILTLEGSSRSLAERELALRLARTIESGIENKIDSKDLIGGASLIIDVMFVESTKQNSLDFGLQGYNMAGAKGETIATAESKGQFGSSGSIFWTIAPLKTMLKLLQTKLVTHVVSNPRVVVRSGTEAKFHSGGTIFLVENIQDNTGKLNSQIFPVEYGMVLNAKPRIDSLGQIDASLSAEVSEFSSSLDGGLPGVSISKTETSVTLRNGYSVLLTGFKNVRERKKVTRIPFLGDIPILGELFKSREFSDENKELMVLLTIKKSEIHEDQIKAFESIKTTSRDISAEFTRLNRESEAAASFSIFD